MVTEALDQNLKAETILQERLLGGVDTQRVLPNGTSEDVRKEGRKRIDDLASQGGYILSTVRTVQSDVSPENIFTMFDEAAKYGA